jgi:hypothetical protein
MKFFDIQHPMFIPLWRRLLIVAASFGWAMVELSSGQVFWAALFGAAGLYCAYQFFVVFDLPALIARRDATETPNKRG